MATAGFQHDGNAIDHTPTADVAAGDVVVQGDLIGVAKTPIPANTLGALAVVGARRIAHGRDALFRLVRPTVAALATR